MLLLPFLIRRFLSLPQALVNRVSIASKEHNSTMYALTFIIKNTIIMIYSIIFTNSFYIFYVINSGILSMDVFPVASWDELNARVCPGATRGPREIKFADNLIPTVLGSLLF